MSDNKRNRRSFNGKGYYIALILCAAAIGISGYLYYQNANEPEPQLQQPTGDVSAMNPTGGDVQTIGTKPGEETPTQGQTPDPTAPTQKKTLKTGSPLSGQTVADYAMDCLCYNPTTRDWRTHNGMDFAAEAGTEVLAAADGTVYTIYNDETMGTTVVIRHEDGYVTTYSSLAEDVLITVGQEVEVGQPIGYVGTSALVETVLGDHVHFSVSCGGQSVDPEDFFELGN